MFLDFYHLRDQPFGVTPDPAYLYPSRTHCEALDSLTDAILTDRGFLALIAEPGMGKTTLLYQLLEGLRDAARAAYLFQTQCNAREFFQYLLSELGVDAADMGLVAMHTKLNEILFAEMLAGRRFVLIVDEAQNLDETVLETIRLLSNFETPHAKLMQIVLAGQPQLEEKLRKRHMAQLLQRITVVKHLEALSPEETTGYVRHRLRIAGYSGYSLFDAEALALIAKRSRGVPRTINQICYCALMEACARGYRSVTPLIVEKATRSLEGVGAARPRAELSPAPMPALMTLPVASTSGAADAESEVTAPRLTYRPLAGTLAAGWSLRAVAVIGLLLSATLVLPHNLLPKVMQVVRNGVGATKSLVQHNKPGDPRSRLGALEQPAGPAAHESFSNESGMPNVTGIQTMSAGGDARVVVMLDGAVQYDSARITSPDRIYFDLYKAHLSPFFRQTSVPAEGGLLKWVRAAQNKDEVVRLVLDADGAKQYSAQLLPDPYRLVIDVHSEPLADTRPGLTSDAGLRVVSDAALRASASNEIRPSLTRELGLKINRIAIDPGHGGNDTGTTGPEGLLEKDLCLDVALRLGRLIEENIPDTEVVYTRKDDRHVSLEDRTAIANNANADLFISIHANSSASRETRGVETYYLSLAASPESRLLATRENAPGEASLHDLADLIKKISSNEKIAESKLLAMDIQNMLAQRLQLVSRNETNRGVKKAPFIVLTGANMPAVLTEISFVSNASDERLLLQSSQRQCVAEGLYHGIAVYLESLHSLQHQRPKIVYDNRPGSTFGFATAKATNGRNPL